MIRKERIDSVTKSWEPYDGAQPYCIYLAGDSTMQSYGEDKRPQYGWGEALLSKLDPGHAFCTYHREDCPFPQQLCYESRKFIIDNCAMAGRSSRSFKEEGRLADIWEHIRKGDYLLIQFGHNDGAKDKQERYVSTADFEASLNDYIYGAISKGAIPILISSIALHPCEETLQGALGDLSYELLKYADIMQKTAEKNNLLYVDMGELTRAYCMEHREKTGELYMPDHVHLVGAGADIYAELLANKLRREFTCCVY